jgi:hypothetical protein
MRVYEEQKEMLMMMEQEVSPVVPFHVISCLPLFFLSPIQQISLFEKDFLTLEWRLYLRKWMQFDRSEIEAQIKEAIIISRSSSSLKEKLQRRLQGSCPFLLLGTPLSVSDSVPLSLSRSIIFPLCFSDDQILFR